MLMRQAPSIDESIFKVYVVYRYGEFYSTMKDKITSFARKLVELEIIISSDGNHISSEISHSQKDKN